MEVWQMVICAVPDCGKIAVARSLCAKHYQRQRFHGDPLMLLTKERKKKPVLLKDSVADEEGV
jgi:hypothetical protein